MRHRFVGALPWLGLAVLAWMAGCRSMDWTKSDKPRAMPDLTPTSIEYVDTDAFDGIFESALVNQDAVILVRSGRETADWGPRLNAWIAAWNRGGHSRSKKTARGQAPTGVPRVVIDGDSIREFRLLIEGLIGRIEDVAQGGSAWYRDQRQRSRRVALLEPYSLRFHKGEEGLIELIFFHERYSEYYPRFVQKLTGSETMAGDPWARTLECSECKADRKRRDQLTNRER